ncbi:AAC(3) family N-acetyltransferase (plasmid) [Ureibacillus chungkukjangi]|uniref:aminoglycoside N(3)-acetyltransferase n=1 Tax=Ureibacillus chungkukjangi TaxID=1202712 RepID=UPI000D333275|nr:AAC(3) family N-acetyltransferase [Ureibacillus chungkukjangi]MCM3390619.1 AAC(3) family N-acetyltransferase [Ureibacillus chungkukjangi]HCG4536272.1 AAC(3) family N-acetyltransferase [Salmonella enterica subsp. enterica serovar Typhi str. AG3]
MSSFVNKVEISNTQLLHRNLLVEKFKEMGIKQGMTIIVHSSLSSLGWVSGGAITVINSLMDVVTKEGTIVMPAHSVDNSDPQYWEAPPVPKEWWETIRDTLPPFDLQTTPTFGLGIIPELFRSWPGVLRSNHPMYSFTAWGRHSKSIVADHSLNFGLGKKSPLGKLYELDAYVLLLGVGFENNTSFHMAEYQLETKNIITQSSAILEDGERVWKTYKDIDLDPDDIFEVLGEAFEIRSPVTTYKIANAKVKFFKQKDAVNFAFDWLKNR